MDRITKMLDGCGFDPDIGIKSSPRKIPDCYSGKAGLDA